MTSSPWAQQPGQGELGGCAAHLRGDLPDLADERLVADRVLPAEAGLVRAEVVVGQFLGRLVSVPVRNPGRAGE